MTERCAKLRLLRKSVWFRCLPVATRILSRGEKDVWRGFFSPRLSGVSRWCWLEAVRWFLRPRLFLVCGLVAFAQLLHFPIFYQIVERTRGSRSGTPLASFVIDFMIIYLCFVPLCLCFWAGLTLGGRRLKHLYRDLQVTKTPPLFLLGGIVRNAMLLGLLAYLIAVIWTLFVICELEPHVLLSVMRGYREFEYDYRLFYPLLLLGVTWIPGWLGIVFSVLVFRVARRGSTVILSGAVAVISLFPSLPYLELNRYWPRVVPRVFPSVFGEIWLWYGSHKILGILAWAFLTLICQSVLLGALGKEGDNNDRGQC